MITAKIVADSLNEHGNRITTMEVVLPRFILAELNTHRMFSRNSASSRAIPFEKMVKMVQEDPFVPIAWQKDHKGMQGTEYITDIEPLEGMWLRARDRAVQQATSLYKLGGVTKQLCNRLLEPFMWHKVLLTATEFENFFKLRTPQYEIFEEEYPVYFKSKKDVIKYFGNRTFQDYTDMDWLSINKGQAEIHMMALSEAMWDVYQESTPKQLKAGEWHIPYATDVEIKGVEMMIKTSVYKSLAEDDKQFELMLVKAAVARCARVSYTVVGEDKPTNYATDINLYNKLLESKHYSPFEHCARAMDEEEYETYLKTEGVVVDNQMVTGEPIFSEKAKGWSRNFRGWIQYRAMIDK